ncbi:hypothetical protein J7I97_16855 [Streptomyces sp. ISL-87]|uniref:DUF6283 family protein n=1 Tax=Streptomyces sp. ISL-87 TaxID=2819188 RepID=UPI001BEB6611|nr:DUF6283 family protein [Streptomyces sp. ISL-87]MBT2609897.1 hypothetical protein [Streptomyces sp. ISL-87]
MTDGLTRETVIKVGEEVAHRKAPCNECPWRVDAPVGRFSMRRFEEMRQTSEQPSVGDHGAMIKAAAGQQEMFGCHKGDPGTGDDLACAGWLAVAAHENISVRLDVALGRLPASALSPGLNWPELYDSYDAMVEAQSNGSAGET